MEFLLLDDDDEDEDEEEEGALFFVVAVVVVFAILFGSTVHRSMLCRCRMATKVYSLLVWTSPCAGTGRIQLVGEREDGIVVLWSLVSHQ